MNGYLHQLKCSYVFRRDFSKFFSTIYNFQVPELFTKIFNFLLHQRFRVDCAGSLVTFNFFLYIKHLNLSNYILVVN